MLQKQCCIRIIGYKITSRSVSLRQLTELVNYYAPPLMAGALSDDPVWRLSVAYIGSKSRTERPGETKIGTEVAHVTRDSDISFKVKVSRPLCSPPCWRVRWLQRWAWERVGRGKLLLRCRLLGGARHFGAHAGGEGRGHIVAAARLQLVISFQFELSLR